MVIVTDYLARSKSHPDCVNSMTKKQWTEKVGTVLRSGKSPIAIDAETKWEEIQGTDAIKDRYYRHHYR